MNKQTLNEKLPTLIEREFIVVTRKVGKSYMFQLNNDSSAIGYLKELERNLSMDGIDVESKSEHSVDDLNFFDYPMQKRASSLRD